MSKFSNVLKMIKILEGAKEPIKRKDIAKMLEVSPRMVRKYIDDLKESGYNVISTSGRNGGLQLEGAKEQERKEQEKMKEIFLTSEERFFLKSLLTLNALDITEKLLKIVESNQTSETELKILAKQNETINNIFNKL